MRKLIAVTICLILFSAFPSTSNAATKIFKNCTELNKVYPGGVARIGAMNSGGKTKIVPNFNDALYKANKKLDRDSDGIACEK